MSLPNNSNVAVPMNIPRPTPRRGSNSLIYNSGSFSTG
ncbi:hypothetical protein AYI68_g5786, partial [Smittium mucronatum]